MNYHGLKRSLLHLSAVVVPLAISGLLFLLARVLTAPAAALILVLLVVGGAATGDRTTGLLAALSSALGFDFFLTTPNLDLHIANAEDIELAVMLLLIGLAVNELALRGARHLASASERAGFMNGVLESADLSARGIPISEAADTVAGHMRHTIGAVRVTYQAGPPSRDAAIVHRDGTVSLNGVTLSIAADGLPTDRYTAVPVLQGERTVGHFMITTASRLVRPSPEQLRVAVLLADQLARRRLAPAATRSSARTGWST